jgi:hypothetical protein
MAMFSEYLGRNAKAPPSCNGGTGFLRNMRASSPNYPAHPIFPGWLGRFFLIWRKSAALRVDRAKIFRILEYNLSETG